MSVKQQILICDDQHIIHETLGVYLRNEGFECISAFDGEQAIEEFNRKKPNLVILDLMMPKKSGMDVCREIRQNSSVPIIMLTAKSEEIDRVLGLELGAEDYIAKPFRARELVSRIRSVLRRSTCTRNIVQLENVTVDTDKGTVTKNGAEIALSALEYRILLVFIGNRGRLLSRSRLLEEIWDVGGDFVNDNTLTVYIKRLREKIEDDPQDPHIIKTVRGLGYRVD